MTSPGWTHLEGDGDFRSAEVRKLRDEADIIITNPPFSLFREFLKWIVKANKKFVILGNMNAITYKEAFPLIQQDKMWLVSRSVKGFASPVIGDYTKGVYDADTGLVKIDNVCWFSNIDHGQQNQPLQLMTMAENIERSKHQKIRELGYQTYDNYDAIEVPFTDAIPSDFKGVMGVPISFLSKYNPEQFEIVGNMDDHSQNIKIGVKPVSKKFIDGYRTNGGTGAQRAGGYWVGLTNPHRFPYKRIFIRHRRAK